MALRFIMKVFLICVFTLLSFLSDAKHFVIGVQDTSYYPLYDFPNPSFSKDLLDAFAASKGYTFDYLPLPIKRINHWFSESSIDFKYPDNSRWLIGASFHDRVKYSDPVVELIACTVVHRSKENVVKKEVRKLGTLLGFHPTLWLDEIARGETILVESPSTLNIVRQTVLGSVDATNIEPNVVFHHLRLLNQESELVISKNIHYETYFYHLSTIKHPEVLKEFNQFLKENQQLLKKLKEKYKIIDAAPYRQFEVN